jgi:hypothetical protein
LDQPGGALAVDDAPWARRCGWALTAGLIAVASYHQTNPMLAGLGWRAVAAGLADHQRGE